MGGVPTPSPAGFDGPSRPEFTTVAAYGASLSDADFWEPYVRAAMNRHGLEWRSPSAGFAGTFPTMLVGDHMVKLFSERFEGGDRHHVECALLRLLAPNLRVPRLVADGALYHDGDWRWPYLVMTRMTGVAWRDACLGGEAAAGVAWELGGMIRQLHKIEPPADLAQRADLLAALRAGALQRHQRWNKLPGRLIEQIPTYVGEFRGPQVRRLIHADLTEGHIFVRDPGGRSRLAGVIDWADAAVTDPYYELVALHLGAFRGDKALLSAFLDGYGWHVDSDFAWRAMVACLLHQHDVLGSVVATTPFEDVGTLADLACALWGDL